MTCKLTERASDHFRFLLGGTERNQPFVLEIVMRLSLSPVQEAQQGIIRLTAHVSFAVGDVYVEIEIVLQV